jgi:hypothetical protein
MLFVFNPTGVILERHFMNALKDFQQPALRIVVLWVLAPAA